MLRLLWRTRFLSAGGCCMDEAKRDLVQRWLVKADHDLGMARKAESGPDVYLDMGLFHCQQAAEKAIKALLVYHDCEFERVHDIVGLVNLVAPAEPRVLSQLAAAKYLTPFAVGVRYPDEQQEPSLEEFQKAFKHATSITQFVLSVLPPEVHPPKAGRNKGEG